MNQEERWNVKVKLKYILEAYDMCVGEIVVNCLYRLWVGLDDPGGTFQLYDLIILGQSSKHSVG